MRIKCEGCDKPWHAEYEDAIRAALYGSVKHGKSYRIYPCPVHGSGYHITTQPDRKTA